MSTELIQITFTLEQLEKIFGAVISTKRPGTKLIRIEGLRGSSEKAELQVTLRVEKNFSNKEVH